MSPRTRLVVFAVLVGIILVLTLSFVGINLPYLSRYLILVVSIVLYFVVVATLERYIRKKREGGLNVFGSAVLRIGIVRNVGIGEAKCLTVLPSFSRV